MKYRRLACTVILILLACGERDTWEGFVYPDRGDLTSHVSLGAFQSLEACRIAALNKLAELRAEEGGDYECGKNCEYKDGMGDLRVCEATER